MEKEKAQEFANEWIAAWNEHDIERILAHYEDDFEMSSPATIALSKTVSVLLSAIAL